MDSEVGRPGHPLAGCHIGVAMVDARDGDSGRTFVAVQGFGAGLQPLDMLRFEVIARVLGARLVVAETPGFSPDSGLLALERRALRHGDFGPLGIRMLDAALAAVDTDHDGRLSFLGYSLGASLAAVMAAAAAERRWTVDDVVLVEPVGLRRWAVAPLLLSVMREARWDRSYLESNAGTFPHHVWIGRSYGRRRYPLARRIDQLHLGSALRHGGLAAVLRHSAVPAAGVTVVRARQSALSGSACVASVAGLRRKGIAIREFSVAGHHGFWHSLAAVAEFTRGVAADAPLDPARSSM